MTIGDRRVVSFTIPGKPQGKGRPKFARRGKYVQTYTPEQTENYENLIRWAYMQNHDRSSANDPVCLRITAVYPVPASAPKKRRAAMLAGEERPTVKPDFDNLAKVVSDAINGIAWGDDTCVVDARVIKVYGEVPEVRVYFDNFSWRDVPFAD
jgi:Holliday junction resolvase RusA-like endonuclease